MKKGFVPIILLFVLSFLSNCGGGGGGGSSSSGTTTTGGTTPASSPTTTQMSTDATVSVLPSEMIKVPVNVEGNVTGVTQVSGVNVSNLTYTMGVLSFIAPAETGKNEVLEFRFNRSDNTSVVYRINMPTLLSPVVSTLETPGDGTSPVTTSDLSITVPSLVNICVLPASFTDFSVVFSSPSGSKISTIASVHLNNGTSGYRITDYFNVNPTTGVVSLKSTSKSSFIADLSDKPMEMHLTGWDTKGLPFAYGIGFYYGSNSVNGRIVNQSGNLLTSLAGKSVLLRGFTSGISQTAVIASDGTFSLSNVVTDNYGLSLIDPSSQYFGTSLFLIPSGNANVSVDLKAIAPMQSPSVEKAAPRAERAPIIEENQNGLFFQKNMEIEPRSAGESPQVESEISKIVSGNSVSVSGAAQNFTVEDQAKIRVPQGTLKVKIRAEVSTLEYPSYTTKPGNKYNDTWQYWWGCGLPADLVGGGSLNLIADIQSGLVNTTHSATGTRVYEKDNDVSQYTKNNPIDCVIGGSTVNIGDGAYPTMVTITLSTVSGLTINKVSHEAGLFQDNSLGGNHLYNMGVPLSSPGPMYGGAPFKIQLQYEPKDATIEKMKIELYYDGKTFLVTEYQAFSLKAKGLLEADVSFPQGVALQPKEGLLANLFVTLAGKVKGVSDTSQPKAMQFPDTKDSFTPIFEVRNAINAPETKRYGSDHADSKGGDGWARADMLNWVNNGTGNILLYNDISGEHAWQDAKGKSLGVHESHKGGYDADVRYYDENGKFEGGMCGQSASINGNLVGGYYIKQVVQAAQEEVENNLSPTPNLDKLKKWINVNRTLLSQLAADPKVKLLYIGFENWFWQPLIWGKFEDGLLDIPGGSHWLDWPDKVEMLAGHESHIHVRLLP